MPAILARLVRTCLAVAMTLSWLLLAGLPASAAVQPGGVGVETPAAGAVLTQGVNLRIYVDRTRPPQGTPKEELQVRTRILDGEGKQVGDTDPKDSEDGVLFLDLISQTKPDDTGTQRLTFAGVIDPYSLAWAGDGVIAPNGGYTLQYQCMASYGGGDYSPCNNMDWQSQGFTIDAAPPAQSAPAAALTDAEKKTVDVSWEANAAPDLVGYTVERRLADEEWKVVAEGLKPKVTVLNDQVPKYGTYAYRVTAARTAGTQPEKEDDPQELRVTTSPESEALAVQPDAPETPDPDPEPTDGSDKGDGKGDGDNDDGDGDGDGGGSGAAQNPAISGFPGTTSFDTPGGSTRSPITAPPGFDETFRGPLDYGVEPREVTERVPVEIAEGGKGRDSTIAVQDRYVDESRVLPPLAGGLILVVSAAHVLRFLNE